jgi:hypothetical protein
MKYLIVLLMVSGCATSTQRFVDVSYEDGKVVREVRGTSISVSPPFRSSSASGQHNLTMQEDGGDWVVGMDTNSHLVGGDVDELVKEILKVYSLPSKVKP